MHKILKSAVVILAAGKGTRMKSDLPKALHKICGWPMLKFLIKTAKALNPEKIIVVGGHGLELLRQAVGKDVKIVHQKALLGSGHAVNQAAKLLKGFSGSVVILYCDTPLLSAATLKGLLEDHASGRADCTLLSVTVDRPEGYGRIKKDPSGAVEKIVEENDATEAEKKIHEINVGCYVFDGRKLFESLKKAPRNPGKNETYLTDTIEILSKNGKVSAVSARNLEETMGINTRHHLAEAQGIMQKKILDEWIEKGVRIRDPRTTVIDAGVRIGVDTEILSHTVIEAGCVIGKKCVIGPFTRLRGATVVGDGAVIGNFVEIVRCKIGRKTQVKHLSYLGDAEVGESVNIGAGTITANYDGKKKHHTVIKDRAQIGSGTVLIAPVVIGRGARTGAGSIVTKGKNVPDGRVVVGVPARVLSKRK